MSNSLELGKKVIKEKIPLIPKNPGIYRMISVSGEILYIGKAKNIPNRLKSYVSDTNLPIRTERMLSLTHNLEITTTNNESEALLLEANLIKKHKPRFNILLRDDKSFPYIYIGHKDKWPQLLNFEEKNLEMDIILDRLLQLDLLIGQLKYYKKFSNYGFVTILFLKIERDHVFYIKLKDVLPHALGILKNLNTKKQCRKL